MRNPRLWRNVGIAVVVSGIVAAPSVFLLPKAAADHWAAGVVFVYGLMAIIFGTLWTIWRHGEARAQQALLRGDDLIARWRVDAATWREFVELNKTFNINTVSVRDHAPPEGVEVMAGRSAVMVDGEVHTLCHSSVIDGHISTWGGDWVIEQAALHPGAPTCIYLYVRMIRSGSTPVYSNLVFPVAAGASREAELAFAHYHQRATEYQQMVKATGDQRSTASWRASSAIEEQRK